MIKVLFVCHGNICRSPMAEFVFKDMVEKEGLSSEIMIASAATSTEEEGSPVHPGTQKILQAHGISCQGKYAIVLTKQDYEKYDYLIGMDHHNVHNMNRLFKQDQDGKISLLLDYTPNKGDIADPWYTRNFEKTYEDVVNGCRGLLIKIKEEIYK